MRELAVVIRYTVSVCTAVSTDLGIHEDIRF